MYMCQLTAPFGVDRLDTWSHRGRSCKSLDIRYRSERSDSTPLSKKCSLSGWCTSSRERCSYPQSKWSPPVEQTRLSKWSNASPRRCRIHLWLSDSFRMILYTLFFTWSRQHRKSRSAAKTHACGDAYLAIGNEGRAKATRWCRKSVGQVSAGSTRWSCCAATALCRATRTACRIDRVKSSVTSCTCKIGISSCTFIAVGAEVAASTAPQRSIHIQLQARITRKTKSCWITW